MKQKILILIASGMLGFLGGFLICWGIFVSEPDWKYKSDTKMDPELEERIWFYNGGVW